MKFKSPDRHIFIADTYEDLAKALWQSAFRPEPTLEEWMAASAKRAALMFGKELTIASPAEHARDWVRQGLLEQLPEDE